MNDYIFSLIKYTALFICILYAYVKLLRIKLKVWDLFDIPIFAAFSSAIHFATLNIRILIPIGFLIFSILFLLLRFRKTLYETVTIGTIGLGITIFMIVPSYVLGFAVAPPLYLIDNYAVKTALAQLSVSIIQFICVFLLFKIRRLRSGVNPKGETATFEILLFFSVGCIFTMMLFYTTQRLNEIILLAITLFGLLLIVWWFRHITYSYRETVNRQYVNSLEDTIEEYKLNAVENELQVAVYAKLFHYLNKAIPNCATMAQTCSSDECDIRDRLKHILREINIADEKCSLKSIPQTGVSVIDAPIIRLYTEAEKKSLNVSAGIYTDVKGWFAAGKLNKDDIHILLTYLSDNAMISALGLPDAKVRVEFSETVNREPVIRIYDSGEQFDEEVLLKLGLEQVTTRAGSGGSGIGLFTVFEILARYGASFTLDETPHMSGFTKVIEIAFDGRRAVIVRTRRESIARVLAARNDITVESFETEILRDGTNG